MSNVPKLGGYTFAGNISPIFLIVVILVFVALIFKKTIIRAINEAINKATGGIVGTSETGYKIDDTIEAMQNKEGVKEMFNGGLTDYLLQYYSPEKYYLGSSYGSYEYRTATSENREYYQKTVPKLLYDSVGWFKDSPEKLAEIDFSKIPSKLYFSFIITFFRKQYGKDFIEFLRSKMDSKEQEKYFLALLKKIDKLPLGVWEMPKIPQGGSKKKFDPKPLYVIVDANGKPVKSKKVIF